MLLKHYLLRVATLLVMLLSFSTTTSAQLLNHVQGRVLVQLEVLPEGQTPRSWFASQTDALGKPLGLKYQKTIHRHSRIYMVSFDHNEVDENLVLSSMRAHQQVQNAQFDHFVKTREEPNDPEFVNQWQYINTGQSGGTPGADIDMELAWDVTTGGLTAEGDTIVACIIDNGVDPNHPDIAPNLWINYGEIPGNGIDDDSNGYVDDYRGWDSGSDNDEVYDGGDHGTPVAGIIGARGNDGFGVAGVNWNVKLMIVQGGTGVESEVLESYGYPLDARMAYNDSNGGKGAFVVTTNASWGVDFGNPADAPLWCAFYDTLGVHGILNCGATINSDQNVDEVGDLPTACPSDYLISVTNMDHNDVKVGSAGYGAEAIDLGAFGRNTWTVALGGGFEGFGGTSGATPHVTGTVALLYSMPCPDFIGLAKSNPGAASLLVRNAILNGVDPNESLNGITVTGGRLNVNNAVQNMFLVCGDCVAPQDVTATVEDDTSAVIAFVPFGDPAPSQINMRYRSVDAEEWILLEDVTSPISISGLVGCTSYEYQFQAVCDTVSSDFGLSNVFVTLGCCENPASFGVSSVDSTSIAFEWSEVYAAANYQLETRPLGAQDWEVTNTTTTVALFTELTPCTTFEYRLRLVCADSTITEYTPIQSVSTFGCGSCIDFEYCEAPSIDVSEEWIANVTLGDINNTSEGGENGYTDYTDGGPTTTIVGGTQVDFVLTPGFAGDPYDERWAIFIDINQDGDFEDDDERVWSSEAPSTTAVSGSFSLPFIIPEGFTRMRVGMVYEASPNPCNSSGSDYGEYEDYCITLEEGTPPSCSPPADLTHVADPANDSTAMFTWSFTANSEAYNLRYRLVGAVDWITASSISNEVVLEGLDSCSNYEAQLQATCTDGDLSLYSETVTFTTACISSTRSFEIGLDNWSVAPNPTRANFQLNYGFAQRPQELAVRLFNQFGHEISYRQVVPVVQGTINMELSDLPAGVYYLRLETERGSSRVRKVVKF